MPKLSKHKQRLSVSSRNRVVLVSLLVCYGLTSLFTPHEHHNTANTDLNPSTIKTTPLIIVVTPPSYIQEMNEGDWALPEQLDDQEEVIIVASSEYASGASEVVQDRREYPSWVATTITLQSPSPIQTRDDAAGEQQYPLTEPAIVVTEPLPLLLATDDRIDRGTNESISGKGVIDGPIVLRTGPSPAHEAHTAIMRETSVTIKGFFRGWLWVKLAEHPFTEGWLMADHVTVTNPTAQIDVLSAEMIPPAINSLLDTYTAVTKFTTNLRSGPGLEYDISAYHVPPRTPLMLVGRDDLGLWVQIADPQGDAGWILASSLIIQPATSITSLPIISNTEEIPFVTLTAFEWGGQTHDMRHSELMSELGMKWVKFQYKWHPHSQPQDVADLITQAHRSNFKILLAIPGQPYPQTIDYEGYTTFLAGVAALNPAPDGIEVWNEMNIDFEWPVGEIDPETYVHKMLAPAYRAIKGANPNIMVISGAPAPTGFDDGQHAWADDRYVAGMAQAGAANYLDCVGVHYNAGATSPYETTGHPAGDFYGWYFLPSMSMYYRAFDGQRPICITEIGYLTQHGYETPLPDSFWWASRTTVEDHGLWLAQALQLAHEKPYIQMLIIFNVDFLYWGERDPQAGYALIRSDTSCPACVQLKSAGGSK